MGPKKLVKKNILFLRMVQFNEKIKLVRVGGSRKLVGRMGVQKDLEEKNGPIERQNWFGEELTWSKHVQLEALPGPHIFLTLIFHDFDFLLCFPSRGRRGAGEDY